MSSSAGVSLDELPKSHVFTDSLPADAAFPTPESSEAAPRAALGPRQVRGACFTWIRPDAGEKEPELLAVSEPAMRTLGLDPKVEKSEDFRDLVAGKKYYKEHYPWAQAYGGWQFGQWAGQLGDGRAISLFEAINPITQERNELQLKGAGVTPYSRFADGKAVLRSSIREFLVSEGLHALGIPTTRALSLTLLPSRRAIRERIEPCAIVARFAPSWIRIGTFDLFRWRGDRKVLRQLADYVLNEVYGGEKNLPPAREGEDPTLVNRYERLYREICRRNARTAAMWQCYGFMNGVLNTDNTSILGLSLDFGPFSFMDNFDPNFTPNHDDHMLRYSYKNQPTIIWWNLVRLGEGLAELFGTQHKVDEPDFIENGVSKEQIEDLIHNAEEIIEKCGEEYKDTFMETYRDLMCKRLGIANPKDEDVKNVITPTLELLESLELDFIHFFRRLSSIPVLQLETRRQWVEAAENFLQSDHSHKGKSPEQARDMIAEWLGSTYRPRLLIDVQDSPEGSRADEAREKEMKSVNPKFVPRNWVLQDVIERVQQDGEREILQLVLKMTLNPFNEEWGINKEQEEAYCGDPPRPDRMMQCSCSS